MEVVELYNKVYVEEINEFYKHSKILKELNNKSVLISGASGMIGRYFIDVLMLNEDINCKVYALGRNEKKAKERFSEYWNDENFVFIECDINKEIPDINIKKIDYFIHAASNTHPVAYATEPISTIMTNIIGTKNMLECAIKHNASRFLFISSVEIYGENRGDVQYFSEEYCGYIDCNTLRAGYTESKRAGEALCQAYIAEKNIDIVIARLPRVYGPTMLMSDTKALSQFIKKGLLKENVVLKSEGNQQFSYLHVSDAVNGILFSLVKGENGNAYNISDEKSNVKLKELANDIASYTGTKVVFELPNEIERKGYSKASIALMDSSKIKELGWDAMYNIHEGLQKTLEILANS